MKAMTKQMKTTKVMKAHAMAKAMKPTKAMKAIEPEDVVAANSKPLLFDATLECQGQGGQCPSQISLGPPWPLK